MCCSLDCGSRIHIALASAAQGTVWVRQLLTDLRSNKYLWRQPISDLLGQEAEPSISRARKNDTLESSTISSGNRWRMEMWSWPTVVQTEWLQICLLKAWVVNSSGNYERCLDWMRCRLVPPASKRECWGSVEYFVMTIYLFQGPN